jgi:hypothetical protein
MEPVPSHHDDIFTVKTRKNTCQGRNFRSIFFYTFFFQIDAKFDADFNGIGPESRKRQLHAQNLKKPAVRVENLEVFFFMIFFLKSIQNLMLNSMKQVPSPKNDNFMEKYAENRVVRVENLELLFLKIFFFKSMQNFVLISKIHVLSYEILTLMTKTYINDVGMVGFREVLS